MTFLEIDINFAYLRSLRAILGVTVLVVYLIIKKSAQHDPVIKSILDRLRHEDPSYFRYFESLPDKQKESLIKSDGKLRKSLSEMDRRLLKTALQNQFKTNIFVYCLSGTLLIAGFGFYVYQSAKELEIISISLTNLDGDGSGLIVGILPVAVTCSSSGISENVEVSLENAQTSARSQSIRVKSIEGKVVFNPDPYTNFDKILGQYRRPGEETRVRIIVSSEKKSFESKEFKVTAGTTIIAYPEYRIKSDLTRSSTVR